MFKILFLLFLVSTPLFASYAGLPMEYMYSFTMNGRAAGMGNAYTANTGDITGAYWNPAGINRIHCTELNVLTVPLFADTQFIGMSFGYPITGRDVFGISISKLTSGTAERTNSIGENIGYTFRQIQSAYYLTYASRITENTGIGINLKLNQNVIDTYSQQNVNIDIGITISDNASWGLCIQNLLPGTMGKDKINPVIKTGLMERINQGTIFVDVYVIEPFSWDRDVNPANQFRWNAGIEWPLLKKVSQNIFIRAGINNRETTAGLGFMTKKVCFDYAVSLMGIDYVHKFSISLKYGFLPTEEEIAIRNQYNELNREIEKFSMEYESLRKDLADDRRQLTLDSWLNGQLHIAGKQYEMNEYKQCTATLNKILAKIPDNQDAKTMLQEIQNRTQQADLTRKFLEAQDFYLRQDYNTSLKISQEIVNIQPDNQQAQILVYLNKAQQFIQNQKFSDAKNELMEIMKLNPQHNETTELLKRLETILEISK
jgi:tetratricopeptide (TPR) repeat protein